MITLPTLRDFAESYDLHCHCNQCGHANSPSWMFFANRYGWDFPVKEIAARLVCKQCGSRDGGIRIVYNRIGG